MISITKELAIRLLSYAVREARVGIAIGPSLQIRLLTKYKTQLTLDAVHELFGMNFNEAKNKFGANGTEAGEWWVKERTMPPYKIVENRHNYIKYLKHEKIPLRFPDK